MTHYTSLMMNLYLLKLETVGENFDILTLNSEESKYNPELKTLETEM